MKIVNPGYEKKPRIGAFVDLKVYQMAKAKAALEGKTISDLVEELLRAYISDLVDTAKKTSKK